MGVESGLQPDLFSSHSSDRAQDRSGGTRRGLGLGLHWAVALAGEQWGSPSGNISVEAPVYGPCLGVRRRQDQECEGLGQACVHM